ncbi:MAG: hypothetical protein GX050_01165 [Firmicutes bacterium]|nr:hypothetical protein [Bacillota bacterium]
MKRLPLVLLFCCLVLCLLLAGCKNNGSSSGTTIRGQIVINGEPARPDQAILGKGIINNK